MSPTSTARRQILKAGLATASLFLPTPFALVWAQSEGALRLMRLPKVALVVGNGAYQHVAKLRNAVNDARAMSAALKESRFEVTTLTDATRTEMLAAVQQHLRTLEARKCVGLVYFATHGLQLSWRNYLLPIDAAIARPEDVAPRCVDVGTVADGIKRAGNPMNVIILDACRENPFATEQKGLSQMDAPTGTLLAYATAPGNMADDGEGANGLYTEHLLREMRVRDAKIEDVFKRVRLGVRRASRGTQVPWESTSLEEDFYFLPPEQLRKLSEAEEQRLYAEELAAFEQARAASDPVLLERYLRRYPSGRFAELAQLFLDRVLAAQGEKRVEAVVSEGNPHTAGSARSDTAFKVGDLYAYRLTPQKGEPRDVTQRVTAVTANEVVFNQGRLILDPLGNVIRTADGRRYSPRQDVPLEYAVGKRWTSRFELLEGGPGTFELEFRIVARERIAVPAGTFDCFRIEGRGLNTHIFRPPETVSLTYWREPRLVRRWVKFEEERYSKGSLTHGGRQELLSFQQS